MGILKRMGAAIKKTWDEAGATKKHTLWRGKLVEVDLKPLDGFQWERTKAANGSTAKVVWVELARNQDASKLFVLDEKTGKRLGELESSSMKPNLIAALEPGTDAGTCFVTLDDGVWNARLRLGDHPYMPKRTGKY